MPSGQSPDCRVKLWVRALSACIRYSIQLHERLPELGWAVCLRFFSPRGVLVGPPLARVSLQEAEHESGRLETSPMPRAGVAGSPCHCPGYVWRRTRLQPGAGGHGVRVFAQPTYISGRTWRCCMENIKAWEVADGA